MAAPDRFTLIDSSNRAAHSYLTEEDQCYFFREFFAGKGFSGGETNQLISNFKIEPTALLANPNRQKYKEQAIHTIADDFRRILKPHDVGTKCTFVPIPPSKVAEHPDYCDRLERALRIAFDKQNMDLRRLLIQTTSTNPDHKSATRISYEDLLAVTHVNSKALDQPLRPIVMLVDDVLTTGKHFKVGKQRILEANPHADVRGLFIARRVPQEISFVDLEKLSL